MSGLRNWGPRSLRRDGRRGYDATVTGGFALVARRGELAADVAAGSGLRKDGPSIRMVMQ
jgi:hypothetical protein